MVVVEVETVPQVDRRTRLREEATIEETDLIMSFDQFCYVIRG